MSSRKEPLLFSTARTGVAFEDCYFYHTMDIPEVGEVQGAWDLRKGVSAYLGHLDLAGKKVLEIGPASGFLTFEMERAGARVTAVEVPDEPGWDFVPFPAEVLEPLYGPRCEVMHQLKNSWWFNHHAFKSSAMLAYADVYALPLELGRYDIAVMGSVLLHTKAPLQIIEQCANHADTLIITDMLHPELEGSPVCRLVPSERNVRWDTWWEFSTDFLIQFLGVMGFRAEKNLHSQPHHGHDYPFFTLVARRVDKEPNWNAPSPIKD